MKEIEPNDKRWGRFAFTGLSFLVLFLLAVRIFSYHSPTVDVLGSYFPSWMVCILSGIALTLVTRWFIQARRWDPYFGPAPLIYSCLMIIFTFGTWILFYQN